MGFSVVVPLYNKAPFVESMLSSLVNQLGDDDEIIVVDDGSTDDSVALVSKFLNPKLRIVHTLKNSGPGAARNYGVKYASGTHVLFFDADDLAHPELLNALRMAISLYPDKSIWSYRIAWQSRGESMCSAKLEDDFADKIFILDCHSYLNSCLKGKAICTASSTCVSTDLFRDFGGFLEDLRFGEDPELWSRLSSEHPIVFIDYDLAFYREDLRGLSFRYRNQLGSVEKYVNTLLKLHFMHGKAYKKLAFLIVVKNLIFSLVDGSEREKIHEFRLKISKKFPIHYQLGLLFVSWMPTFVFRCILMLRGFLRKS